MPHDSDFTPIGMGACGAIFLTIDFDSMIKCKKKKKNIAAASSQGYFANNIANTDAFIDFSKQCAFLFLFRRMLPSTSMLITFLFFNISMSSCKFISVENGGPGGEITPMKDMSELCSRGILIDFVHIFF